MVPALLISLALAGRPQGLEAGGPHVVAGSSYFDPAVKGLPLTWSQGVILYYTDRGNLSPVLPSDQRRRLRGRRFQPMDLDFNRGGLGSAGRVNWPKM